MVALRARILLALSLALLVLVVLGSYELRMSGYPGSAFQRSSLSYTILTAQTVAAETLRNYTSPTTSQAFSGKTVTYSGIFKVGEANPVCTTAYPPCKAFSVAVFYLITESGARYRLLLSFSPEIPDGTKVAVRGMLLIPSAWNTSAWLPSYYFNGDILVQSMYPT